MRLRVLAFLWALLLAWPLAAAELKIATWNMDWLTARPPGDPALPGDVHPRAPQDFDRLRQYAAALDADVVALQEVDGPAVAGRIFPPDRYALHFTQDDVVQRVGFAVRRTIRFTANPDLAALDVDPGALHHLRSGADITLDLPDARLRLLAVHLKTGCQEQPLRHKSRACDELREQVPPLQGWIAQRSAEGVPFLILGDFNRVMDGRDAVLRALDRAASLPRAQERAASFPRAQERGTLLPRAQERATLLRATAGRANPCWDGASFIDHILAGGAARAWMQPDTLRVLVYRETGREWRDRLSDHCPVSVRLNVPG